ncbi:flagellar biosynthetic protein FliR [Fusibacter ferrireducens]|uniref:Flagellar biosynthetic protein FliR n=1 Tax=Fusibacter ferrireducens TaxID=2785058 RepID=A0ABR9ZMQ5_9FIRM|nr:flagellar biosynthetic protein FliR [Fusibacter ferrireducens]MBF4691742.1 flagellar biosynthetic protein FliR [Fusibacter ferrireducens]
MAIPFFDLILIFARIGGLIFTAPIFGSRNYPTQVKIGLILFLSLILFPLVNSDIIYDVSSLYQMAFLLINEIFIGVFMGLILTIYMGFIYFAGDLIDRDLGFAMVNVVNPLDESQIAITSNLFYIFSMLIFLQLDFHHELITALVVSFEKIKLGAFFFAVPSFDILLDIIEESFVLGFQIAAPFVITVLIANIILGLLAKAMPGMNVFILGMPFKIFFGFLLFIILMPYMYDIFAGILGMGFQYIVRFFNLF